MTYRDSQQEGFRFEPAITLVYLVLTGIVILFMGLVAAYLFNGSTAGWETFHLPRVFWLSSIMAVAQSICMRRVQAAFRNDQGLVLIRLLALSICLSLLFVVFQWKGWTTMHAQGQLLAGTPASGYIYVISGLHVVHVLVGIVMLMVAWYRARRYTVDPAMAIYYFTDPVRRRRLALLGNYWHTIDYLWVFLFLVFLYRHA
jgi:cytochrome c oxidase subunit 3